MTPALLRQLLGLAEARKARDLARLDVLAIADRALSTEAADVARSHAEDMGSDEPLPLARLGLRLRWADQRIAAIAARRAALIPEIAAARREATGSLGKHEALGRLLARALLRAEQEALSKAEREAPPREGRADQTS